MPGPRIIVVGASAGGVEALKRLAADLPVDLAAAVFVVLHLAPDRRSLLAEILGGAGPLPAVQAEHGAAIRPGRIVVARPDRHLMIERDRIVLSRGPRENRSRPAIDPTFRTASRAYGPDVAGVILSGALGDGSAGLMAIKARRGLTVVQEPAEALFEDMPRAAIRDVGPDHVLPIAAIGPLLSRWAASRPTDPGDEPMSDGGRGREAEQIRRTQQDQADGGRPGAVSTYTCPECGGSLWQFQEGPVMQFRCHVGHSYSAESLLSDLSDELEAALWSCVRMLAEKATVQRQLAAAADGRGHPEQAELFREHAEAHDLQGRLIRERLLETIADG